MAPSDVERVVTIHVQSFPGFFLSYLGSAFLRLYYTGVCDDPKGIALVYAIDADEVVGFIVGSSDPRGFYSRMLRKRWLSFSFAATGAMLRKPRVIPRVARAFFYPGTTPAGGKVAGLYSVAVHPSLQGAGAGKALVRAFIEEAKERGCSRVFLITDRDNNEGVNRFYSTMGFSVSRQFATPEGRWMNEYWLDLE